MSDYAKDFLLGAGLGISQGLVKGYERQNALADEERKFEQVLERDRRKAEASRSMEDYKQGNRIMLAAEKNDMEVRTKVAMADWELEIAERRARIMADIQRERSRNEELDKGELAEQGRLSSQIERGVQPFLDANSRDERAADAEAMAAASAAGSTRGKYEEQMKQARELADELGITVMEALDKIRTTREVTSEGGALSAAQGKQGVDKLLAAMYPDMPSQDTMLNMDLIPGDQLGKGDYGKVGSERRAREIDREYVSVVENSQQREILEHRGTKIILDFINPRMTEGAEKSGMTAEQVESLGASTKATVETIYADLDGIYAGLLADQSASLQKVQAAYDRLRGQGRTESQALSEIMKPYEERVQSALWDSGAIAYEPSKSVRNLSAQQLFKPYKVYYENLLRARLDLN